MTFYYSSDISIFIAIVILKKMDGLEIPQPTENELKAIEEEEKQGLKDQMLEYIKDGYTIH